MKREDHVNSSDRIPIVIQAQRVCLSFLILYTNYLAESSIALTLESHERLTMTVQGAPKSFLEFETLANMNLT